MNFILDNQLTNENRISTHNVICTLKKFKDQRYTRIRSQDLQRISTCNNSTEVQKTLATSELERRSYVDSQSMGWKYEITLHALDRLSILYLHKFIQEFDGREGISSWCNRLVKEALKLNKNALNLREFSLKHEGITFSFRESTYIENTLVLTTII